MGIEGGGPGDPTEVRGGGGEWSVVPSIGGKTVHSVVAALAALAMLTPNCLAATDSLPATIPALRSWTPAGGPPFALTRGTRVIAPPSMRDEATRLAADLGGLIGRRISSASGRPRAGDVVLA